VLHVSILEFVREIFNIICESAANQWFCSKSYRNSSFVPGNMLVITSKNIGIRNECPLNNVQNYNLIIISLDLQTFTLHLKTSNINFDALVSRFTRHKILFM
jgi:hypothetical protein